LDMITEFISSLLYGKNGTMTIAELKAMTERKKFSDYLPYIAYDGETGCYLNQDNTIGFIWECSPLCFSGEKTISSLTGVFRAGLPEGSVVQISLLGDKHIASYIEAYRNSKSRPNPLIKKSTDALCSFMYQGMNGTGMPAGIPTRIFRLLVSAKVPLENNEAFNMKDTYLNIEESLRGAGLYPRPFPPIMLIELLRRIFNDRSFDGAPLGYDEAVPLRKQIILSDTEISKSRERINIGGKIFRCITPKAFPKEVDPLMANELFGGVWGVRSDGEQIQTPFLYTINIIVEKLTNKLHWKCDMVLRQQGVGSFAPGLMRKKDEFVWAVDQLDRGVNFVRIMPIIWTWSESESRVSESISRIKRIWESRGCTMQEDKGILPILFLSALPFGLYNVGRNIEDMDRDFIVPPDTAMTLAPVQADFAGGGSPVLLFVGRKGEMVSLDIFDRNAGAHNCIIAASTGKGKSFAINYFAFNHFARGGLTRIIDIGHSYKKMTKMLDAVYLDFDESSKICINPFATIIEEDKNDDIPIVAAIVLQMAYSSTDVIPQDIAETASTLAADAVSWAYEQEGTNADIDLVHRYLNEFPRHAKGFSETYHASSRAMENFATTAHTIAFNLRAFTSEGFFGRWFNGASTFDISRDEFVVLELDNLSGIPPLFKVVVMQVVNAVTQDLYLSNREKPRMVIFDEAWQLKDNPFLKKVIEGGYRKARKYKGSFTIVTQSPLDLRQFGDIGDVVNANSPFKFYLESPDFEKARQEKIINCDDFTLEYLKSVMSVKGKYSELYMDTPFGKGVARLIVDPFSYFVYTSDATEISEIESFINRGMSYDQAIEEMVRKYRS
jgi:conjugal transfer ATP-binding protein TraC